MDIKGKSVLLLGGWGLVGTAICHKLIEKKPKNIIISSLTKEQAKSACKELAGAAGKVKLIPEWGDVFVRTEFKDIPRSELLEDQDHRLTLAADVLERTTATSFGHFFLYDLISLHKPDIVIDCINTATGVAYQNVYNVGLKLLQSMRDIRKGKTPDNFNEDVERLLGTLYLPQLVRHVQILYQAMKDVGTRSYMKVGTTGTGGMGLNIPYTHSEDKPSRVLLSKTCVGGAHSLLLMLMGRTPDAPYTKEIKPAAAIAWKKIEYGNILRGGKPIPLYDCPVNKATTIGKQLDTTDPKSAKSLGGNLQGVFIDTGENGTFSLGEFTAITTSEQMEYVTPEEIAQYVVWELEGGNSGKDIVGALDAAILSPSYRAGVMRATAIAKMKAMIEDNGDDTAAFELLGPPRLSKLLYEALLLKKSSVSINGILAKKPEQLSKELTEIVKSEANLRSKIISIGIPILLPEGDKLLRGPQVKVPQDPRTAIFDVTPDNIDKWCDNGWVDLRPSNMKKWKSRLTKIVKEAGSGKDSTSSRFLRDKSFWNADESLNEGELVGWIFIEEDKGRRIK